MDTDEPTEGAQQEAIHPKPPPIFIYGVTNYQQMKNKIREIVEDEQYNTKTLAENTIKINPNTSETYRKMIKFMREQKIIHHTYQPKEERAFQIVVKHLHYSTDIEEIKEELSMKGHTVRNIVNVKRRITKEPLNLFFVDLEPAGNNKDIYKLHSIQNNIIKVEPPRKASGLAQCMRCQQYGHTKTYCTRPFVCVKCGGSHATPSCKKTRDTPATCTYCNGPHPANYKGCEFYHRLVKRPFNANNRLNIHHNTYPPTRNYNNINTNVAIPFHGNQTPAHFQQKASYANVVSGNTNQEPHLKNNSTTINTFLEEFKAMFQQLVQQNSMILNMLTTLISKIH
jgi:hypothetical protein